ncbi:hypothetical protein LT85_0932 [Collimonas arenae]|uniref:Uncharacterized protein n=1 Tax=Collimonas arenae TaxID=279058 RepID=A0A0A1F8I7_9BURK|nr:hypothetical protein LT85_0932 [Collimonas arenae]
MPGIADEIEGAVQQAPQSGRQTRIDALKLWPCRIKSVLKTCENDQI